MGEQAADGELVRRFTAGDPAAFEQLVSRHEERLYNLSYRMLGSREDARDATQEAFLAALRALPSFRGDAAFTTWLHRIAVNACYDVLRRQRRAPVADVAEDAETWPPSPDHAESAATAVDVQRALARVPEEFRAVLVLHDVQDLPYEQIGAILGIPVGTVKSRLHRGRVSLAGLLRGTPGAPAPSEGTVTT